MVKFSAEEKIKAVKQFLEGNESGKTIAQSIGVHYSNFHQWVKLFNAYDEEAFIKSTVPVTVHNNEISLMVGKINRSVRKKIDRFGVTIDEVILPDGEEKTFSYLNFAIIY